MKKRDKRSTAKAPKRKLTRAALVPAGWILYFVVLFPRMISMRPDGLYMGHENLWSDWSLHVALARIFAFKPASEWFAYHPLYAGGKLTYAFLTNWISGMLMRAGMDLTDALVIPSILFSIALVLGMYFLAKRLLGSAGRAGLAISLFFLSSGLGFFAWLRETVWLGQWGKLVPSREYSKWNEYGWGSGNFLTGQLVPQRAFLLGMALAVFALWAVFDALAREGRGEPVDRRKLWGAALATGLLPIAHMHSLIALLFLLGPLAAWMAYKRVKSSLWLGFAAPAAVLSAVLYAIFVRGKIENPNFMSFHPGYNAHGVLDWLYFWGRAWGPMIPLALGGAYWLRAKLSPNLLWLAGGALALFAVSNLIWFQPLSWDNSKLFLWVYFVFGLVASATIGELWARGRWPRIAAGTLVVLLCTTGFLEAWYLQRVDTHTYRLLDRQQLDLAERMAARSGPHDRFLTAFEHNTWAMVWAARPIVMGYEGWVLNFGFDYGETKRMVEEIYKGGPKALEDLALLNVSYVVVGPSEKRNLAANEAFFQSHFQVADRDSDTVVYAISKK